jgi:hypothetical protein
MRVRFWGHEARSPSLDPILFATEATPPAWSSNRRVARSILDCGGGALAAPEAGEAGRRAAPRTSPADSGRIDRLLEPRCCFGRVTGLCQDCSPQPRPIPRRLRQPQPFGCRPSRIASTRFDAQAGEWQELADVRIDQPSCSARSLIDFEWPLSSCAASGAPS